VWWFYAALGSGPISVVSPLTAILVAGIPVGVGLALGERPGPVALVGVLLALAAVVLVSREATDVDTRSHKFTLKVAWLTVGSGVAFGMNFVILHQVPVEAELWPLVFGRLAAATIVLLAAAATANLVLERGVSLRLALLAGLLDTIANVATLVALQSSMLSLAGVLIALYPAATVLLAILVLRERVTRWQAIGMVLALASVGMIASH
jgi:drug/metabolite transporter (DMT)-like permease